MAIAYSCILIALILPYVWIMLAKVGRNSDGVMEAMGNRTPRLHEEKLSGYRKRALWAHNNAFEALPGCIVSIMASIQVGLAAETINTAAIVFVLARIAHGFFYIADMAWQRSLVWFVGLAAVLFLLVKSIMQVS